MQADCIAAAINAAKAGFDGVEYHFAHGFTLCKFLDPNANQRADRYGGTLENRVRVLTEMVPQIREAVPNNFILSVRMGGNIPDVAGAIEVAKELEKHLDLLHISSGMEQPSNTVPQDFLGSTLAYNAGLIKKQIHIPVIAVGGIATSEHANFLIENDYADFVAVGRAMFADENWANKVLAGEPINQCRNCSRCLWFVDHTKCPARKKLGSK